MVSSMEYARYMLHHRTRDGKYLPNPLLMAGMLTQQYMCDVAARGDLQRLRFFNQSPEWKVNSRQGSFADVMKV